MLGPAHTSRSQLELELHSEKEPSTLSEGSCDNDDTDFLHTSHSHLHTRRISSINNNLPFEVLCNNIKEKEATIHRLTLRLEVMTK